MRKLHIDIETYSEEDLKKCGMYKYTEHPSFQIILIAFAFDDDPVTILDVSDTVFMPEEDMADYVLVEKALTDPSVKKVAHNAAFERTCLAKAFNTAMPPEQWECTMIKAAYMGLPMALGSVASVLKLPVEKDLRGMGLIKYFCLPCKPTKTNGERTRNLPHHAPDKWQAFKEYCVKDVEVEMAIDKHLHWADISPFEKSLWDLDQIINDRGILLDKKFVKNAIQIDLDYKAKLMVEAVQITGLDNPNSVSQLSRWLEQETGDEIDTLKKADIPVMLRKYDSDTVQRMLYIRQELAKTSVKKYAAMAHAVCSDGKVRGLLQFYGANRTGRWAGRLVQVQNLPQNHLADLDLARELVRNNDPETLEMCYGNVPDTLSQLIRTAFVAGKGKTLAVSDFSAIEARVLAWLAGEDWRLDVFNSHGKIYEASAAAMFGVPIESVTKGSELRQKGKVSELACIAENELVLTDRGLIPIQLVKLDDKVFDGTGFCSHKGVIFKGVKKVIEYGKLKATEDHLVWVEGEQEPIQFGIAAASGANLLRPISNWEKVWMGRSNKRRKTMEKKLGGRNGSYKMRWVSPNTMVQPIQFEQRKIEGVPAMLSAEADTLLARSPINSGKTTLRKSKQQGLQKLWGQRNTIQIQNSFGGRALFARTIPESSKRFRNRQERQQRALREGKFTFRGGLRQQNKSEEKCFEKLEPSGLALRIRPSIEVFKTRANKKANTTKSRESGTRKKKKLARYCGEIKVYDILECGGHNRFVVSGALVHNCGYQGGPGALIAMGALKMGLSEDELPAIIDAWREANPAIVKLWAGIQAAAISALKGNNIKYKGMRFLQIRSGLSIELPSGRRLRYHNARLSTNKWGGESIKYEGMDQTTKQWVWVDTYGGKLTENIVQAIARDCLAESLIKVDQSGFDLVMHVHDELIAVVDEETGEESLKIICDIMGEEIHWAKGLPLKGDGYLTKYYKKD